MHIDDDRMLYAKPMLIELIVEPWIIRGSSPEDDVDEYDSELPTGEEDENDDPLA